MSKRFWELVVYCGFALVFVVMVFVVVQWAIDFVRWSKLDSGWAQAIGSVAAIAVAFYIGAKQSRDAIKAIEYGYAHATQRRYKAYSAIAEAARARCEETLDIIRPDGFDVIPFHFSGLADRFEALIHVLKAIPIHEVGTYQAVERLVALRLGLEALRFEIQRIDEYVDNLESPSPNEIRFVNFEQLSPPQILLICINVISNSTACIYRADGLIEALRG